MGPKSSKHPCQRPKGRLEHRECHLRTGGRWSTPGQGPKSAWSPQKRREGSSPRVPGGGTALANTSISDFRLQNCDRTNLYCAKLTGVWSFVMAAPKQGAPPSSSPRPSFLFLSGSPA